MAKLSTPRKGRLQFWPRKRAAKVLPSANWKPISTSEKEPTLLGFIAYKVGMVSASIRDNTEKTMGSGKNRVIPATVLELPNMKIFSVRFYKFGKPIKDIVVSNDKELKRKLRVPKTTKTLDKDIPHE